MLAYIKENSERVDYVIVHKVDRLARNRGDDVDITRALGEANVQLVSASESIDSSPSGMLLHGIMSSIAEFYSQNLSTEVKKGMGQKVKSGGTPTKAPLGYKNIHVYSIDEVFLDATPYLKNYNLSARDFAMLIILDVLETTGITAAAGIGTNLYLCKVAMDIGAKKARADKNGVRIAEPAIVDEATGAGYKRC